MRIAQIAPLVERVPPKKYGGTERIVHALTEELVKRGHEVTLFASGDSITSAKLISPYPRSLREAKVHNMYGLNMWTMLNVGMAFNMQDQFDIIHDHHGFLVLPQANIARVPTVITMHGPFESDNRKIYQVLKKAHLVTISKNQTSASGLNYAGVVYNGLDMENYPFSTSHDGYLLFVGRFCLQKGAHLAIEVAHALDLPLILAAKLEKENLSYFREYIEPFLSEQIKWVGEVDQEQRNLLMSKAMCLINPIIWREPFGLVMIEAMACGCPVVAFHRGSAPELVRDGETGYLVNDTVEMIDAVMSLNKIDRTKCRSHALENFSASKMADGYEEIYKKVIALHQND